METYLGKLAAIRYRYPNRYPGSLIWMDCHPKPELEDYWCTSTQSPCHKALYTAIGRNQWQQINRYFHIWQPTDPTSHTSPDQKAEYVVSCLQTSFMRYWHPGTYIAVDECIEPFFGRCSDTVNIPTKPTPIGFKIWCLADAGYILDFLWHQKGAQPDQGPQGLRRDWQDLDRKSVV